MAPGFSGPLLALDYRRVPFFMTMMKMDEKEAKLKLIMAAEKFAPMTDELVEAVDLVRAELQAA